MTTTAPFTSARRRALEALAATHPRPGRYSNSTGTSTEGAKVALVYWQAAAWLVEEGLVARRLSDDAGLSLTPAGLIACRAAGIEVRNA